MSIDAINVALNVGLTLAFAGLIFELRALRRYINLHHGVLTSVGTMHGLVQALEAGLEAGGLNADTRKAIYHAHDEQVAHVHEIARGLTGEPPASVLTTFAET